jgi:hypothetical protein
VVSGETAPVNIRMPHTAYYDAINGLEAYGREDGTVIIVLPSSVDIPASKAREFANGILRVVDSLERQCEIEMYREEGHSQAEAEKLAAALLA